MIGAPFLRAYRSLGSRGPLGRRGQPRSPPCPMIDSGAWTSGGTSVHALGRAPAAGDGCDTEGVYISLWEPPWEPERK